MEHIEILLLNFQGNKVFFILTILTCITQPWASSFPPYPSQHLLPLFSFPNTALKITFLLLWDDKSFLVYLRFSMMWTIPYVPFGRILFWSACKSINDVQMRIFVCLFVWLLTFERFLYVLSYRGCTHCLPSWSLSFHSGDCLICSAKLKSVI